MNKKRIITDIEGTITDIKFVKDELFVYARQHLATYLRQQTNTEHLKPLLDEIRSLMQQPMGSIEQIISQCLLWIEQDQKITPLKVIQGYIWQQAYQRGEIKGHLYNDAFSFLLQQQQQDIPVYVYSSGSVQAQQLLFQYSIFFLKQALFLRQRGKFFFLFVEAHNS